MQDESGEASKTNGRWTKQEHEKFLLGLELFGKNWKKISDFVGSRNGSQIRSHAQKYFMKLSKKNKNQQNMESCMLESMSSESFRSKQNLNDQSDGKKIQSIGNPYFWAKMLLMNKEDNGFCLWDYIDQNGKKSQPQLNMVSQSCSFKYCQSQHSFLKERSLNVQPQPHK